MIGNETIPRFKDYVICFSSVLFIFIVIFYGSNILCSRTHTNFHTFYFNWEKSIPFVPISYIMYFGILLLPYSIFYFVQKRKDIYTISIRLITAIIIGGITFISYPMKFAFNKPEYGLSIEPLVLIIGAKYNLFPSLHVALTLIIIHGIWPYLEAKTKRLYILIAILLILSTLLTYQHHIIDVFGGILLAYVVKFINVNLSLK